MNTLDGRVAVITGGASGIGAATVKLFVQSGAKVVIADLQEEMAVDLVTELGVDSVAYLRTDVTREKDVEAAMAQALRQFGALDIVFNNAGFGGAMGPISNISEDDYDITFDVLLKGVFFGVKHAARIMKSRGGGSIINTASIAALRSGYAPHLYSVAKAAVVKLTETTAVELAEAEIRVNAICPGMIATPLLAGGKRTAEELEDVKAQSAEYQPIARGGDPSDIANAALYLASDAAGFVTGHALVVDGGILAGTMWKHQSGFMRNAQPITLHRPPDR